MHRKNLNMKVLFDKDYLERLYKEGNSGDKKTLVSTSNCQKIYKHRRFDVFFSKCVVTCKVQLFTL